MNTQEELRVAFDELDRGTFLNHPASSDGSVAAALSNKERTGYEDKELSVWAQN